MRLDFGWALLGIHLWTIKILIDFNGVSSRHGLFYATRLRNNVHRMFMVTFLCSFFLKEFLALDPTEYEKVFLIDFMVECSPMAWETGVQSLVKSYKRLKKWYLIPTCLKLNIMRYFSRVKWRNLGKGVAPILTPW